MFRQNNMVFACFRLATCKGPVILYAIRQSSPFLWAFSGPEAGQRLNKPCQAVWFLNAGNAGFKLGRNTVQKTVVQINVRACLRDHRLLEKLFRSGSVPGALPDSLLWHLIFESIWPVQVWRSPSRILSIKFERILSLLWMKQISCIKEPDPKDCRPELQWNHERQSGRNGFMVPTFVLQTSR